MEPIVIARAPGTLTLGISDKPPAALPDVGQQLTITAAVNYYAYAIVSPSRSAEVHITVAESDGLFWHELRDGSLRSIEAGLPQALSRLFGTMEGLSVFLSTQAPLGLGLGLSGSLMVAMIKALAFSCGLDLEPSEVAALACYVRADHLSLRGDDPCQYATACGGLNGIVATGGAIQVAPLRMTSENRRALEKQLMLFGSPRAGGRPGGSSAQTRGIRNRELASAPPSQVRQDVNRKVRTSLERGDWATLGELLQRTWLERCQLASHGQDNPLIGALKVACDSGALGGQGTGLDTGLLVVLCPEEHQPGVTGDLTELGLKRLPLALEPEGVQVMEAVSRTKLSSISAMQDQPQFGSRLLGLR
jgi:D-glycero-alpha-D-manno-heptose-7-phosphate kinase